MELTAGEKTQAEAKIQRGIFQGDVLSHLLLVIAMIPLIHIFRKCTGGYKLIKSQEKINHLMYMGEVKLFAKMKKKITDSDINNKNKQPGYWNGIWHRKMCHAHNEKWKKTNNRKK